MPLVLLGAIHKVCTLIGGGGVSEKSTFTIKSSNFPIQPAYKGGGGLILVIFVHTYVMDGPLIYDRVYFRNFSRCS